MNLKTTTALVSLSASLAWAAGNVNGTLQTVEGIVSSQERQVILTAKGKSSYELRGDNVGQLLGSRVRVTGTVGNEKPFPALHIQSARVMLAAVPSPEVPGGESAAGGGGGAAPVGGTSKTKRIRTRQKMSTRLVKTLSVGGAAGATVGTLYATDVLGKKDDPSASR